MKTRDLVLVSLIALAGTGGVATAQQETSHYPPGVEGIKVTSLPPPGFYFKSYNLFYSANEVRDRNGFKAPGDFNLDVFATVPRGLWMTGEKILGADFGMDVALPFINVDLRSKSLGVDQSRFGLGDILYEPVVLAWHQPRYDAAAALGIWLPTGEFDPLRPVNVGKGFATAMFSAGATYYFDEPKTWHLTSLARYETNGTKRGIDISPGDDFHIEWALAKTLGKRLDIGLTAYTHWQVTRDTGSAIRYDSSVRDRFVALGPEILYYHEPRKLYFSLRFQKEFAVRDRPEGHTLVFSFLKIF